MGPAFTWMRKAEGIKRSMLLSRSLDSLTLALRCANEGDESIASLKLMGLV